MLNSFVLGIQMRDVVHPNMGCRFLAGLKPLHKDKLAADGFGRISTAFGLRSSSPTALPVTLEDAIIHPPDTQHGAYTAEARPWTSNLLIRPLCKEATNDLKVFARNLSWNRLQVFESAQKHLEKQLVFGTSPGGEKKKLSFVKKLSVFSW